MTKFTKIRSLLAILLLACMLISVFALASCDLFGKNTTTKKKKPTTNPNAIVDPIDDNYRTLYQIYVRSFADSDGDGIGDIRGIIETFDYLNDGDISSGTDLGVQAIWLTPIFDGNSGHNYDAIDFYSIDPEFGKMEDFVELVKLCDKRNVKLILDLALNHTSTICEWFRESKDAHINGNTSNKYYNYYNWSYRSNSQEEVPAGYVNVKDTNWYYESRFDTADGSMPDLNYGYMDDKAKTYTPNAVAKEMLNVAKYWMDLGVDGFRFDAVKYIYYENHVKSSAFYNWYTGELRKKNPDIYLIGECWDDETDILQYYSSMNCFNFPMVDNGTIASVAMNNSSIKGFTSGIQNFQSSILKKNSNGMLSCFLSNHDMDRSAGYINYDNARKMAASLYLLTPGTPVIYYGEEIGLLGSGDSPEDANRRLPMKWEDVYDCRYPQEATYKKDWYAPDKNTVFDQEDNENSLLNHYVNVLKIRHSYPAIARGTYKSIDGGKSYFGGFYVTYNNESMIILHNTSPNKTVTVNLKTFSLLSGYSRFELLEFVGVNDATIEGTTLTLGPQTTVILQ